MKRTIMNVKILFTAAIIFTLHGCGGGSSSSSNNTDANPPPIDSAESSIIVLDERFSIGQSIELVLYSPEQTLTDINWRQSAGESVELLATNSKVISFTPTESGDYTFNVAFNQGSQAIELSQSITVDNNEKYLIARLGHAVSERNKVSLRASIDNSINPNSLQWTQLSGPNINITDTNGQLAVYFNAPEVSQDEIIELRVSAQQYSGETKTDTVSLLIENKLPINSNAYFDEAIASVKPYIENGPYAESLVDCVYSNHLSSSCRLSTLPLIAQDTLSPTIDDIMNRVVVSHPWMGDRFKAFLEQHDGHNDFKNLLRATTAIVISYDIRPAFYWAATGAIYLDPDYLWLTPAERDTINEAPDYRSGFGSELQFEMLWRNVKNNDYASKYFPLNQRITRTTQDTLYRMGYLLYHELAHANDFFPSTKWQQLSGGSRVLDAALEDNTQSDILDVSLPLNSQEMKNLAQARYAGVEPTTTEKSYLPSDIKTLFEPDGAVYFYSYTSTREDYAMLFEELMMYSRYGLSRDIAITNNPPNGSAGSAYIIEWGQRGRVAEQQVKDRVIFASERVLPEFDARTAVDNLPVTKQLRQGATWTDSVSIDNVTPYNLANDLLKRSQPDVDHPVNTGMGYYHKPLPVNERKN